MLLVFPYVICESHNNISIVTESRELLCGIVFDEEFLGGAEVLSK